MEHVALPRKKILSAYADIKLETIAFKLYETVKGNPDNTIEEETGDIHTRWKTSATPVYLQFFSN